MAPTAGPGAPQPPGAASPAGARSRVGDEVDVAVVGYGPVGQALTALLGAAGHRVVAVDRHRQLYPLPRAGHLDGETMRLLQGVGVADDFEPLCRAQTRYDFVDRDGATLVHLGFPDRDPGGWHPGYFFLGTDLEGLLDRAARAHHSVDVRLGERAVSLTEAGDRVRVDTDGPAGGSISARWVIGADGANSFVRAAAGIGWEDLGFEERWLVVDIELSDPDAALPIPEAAQICDPERPVSAFRWLGHRHARLEFRLHPHEEPGAMEDPDRVGQLLAPWGLTPATGTVIRRSVYTFGSGLAAAFRSGRVLLAGDAAHLMPPFLGQGMCTGLCDAATLGWQLDAVLTGDAPGALLDRYAAERRSHAGGYIEASMDIGRAVSSAADVPAPSGSQLRERLTRIRPAPHLVDAGIVDPDAAPGSGAGGIAPQPVVVIDGERGRLDDLAGRTWLLVARELHPGHAEALTRLGRLRGLALRLGGGGPGRRVEDGAGVLDAWLADLGAAAALVRPDHRLFGSARRGDGIGGLVDRAVRAVTAEAD